MLRGSRWWFFSVSEAPDAVSRVHVDLARQPYFCLETDFMPTFQLIISSQLMKMCEMQFNAVSGKCMFILQHSKITFYMLCFYIGIL